MNQCECGCGGIAKNRFVVGHNPKKPRTLKTLTCPTCRGLFRQRNRGQRFCSKRCSGAARNDFPKRGKDHHNYNGGFFYSQGRLMVACRDGSQMAWYRILMWHRLGRPLTDGEVVHHVNGDYTDDRLANLEVLTPSEHRKRHQKDIDAARWPQTEAQATA